MPGIIGWSTKLEHSTAPTPGTYVQVAETVTIQIPAVEVTSVEDTHLGVTDRFRTYVPGLRDSGTISVEANYNKATITALDGLTGTLRTWRITAPDEDGAGPDTAPTFTFQGFISKRDATEMKPDEIAKIKFEIKVTGKVTIA
jgi:hypothetical protein